MAEVKVLIRGYAKKLVNGWLASSSTALIIDKKIKVIADPGTNRSLLINKLKKEGLNLDDIDFVFMTHYHPDHNILMGIFKKAKILDDEVIYFKDKQYEHNKIIPGTTIKIISTPGHSGFHGSLLIPTYKGNIVFAGDLFWWSDEEKQETKHLNSLIKHKDIFAKDVDKLEKSRKKILKIADWVIPGHGKMFKVFKGQLIIKSKNWRWKIILS